MQDVASIVAALRRPRILTVAAQIAAAHYNRERHAARLLRNGIPAKATAIILELLDHENTLNWMRLQNDADYSAQHHVEVLAAIIAEASDLAQVTGV